MTTLVLIGASAPNVARVTAAASSRGLRVEVGAASRPSWVIVATARQRRDALAAFGLPAFRVIEWPGLDGAAEVDPSVLTRGVARMAEIGAYQPVASPAGLAFIRWALPWIMRTLDRAIGPVDRVDTRSDADAAAREAQILKKVAKLENSEEARRRLAERRARRATQRAEEKLARQAEQAGAEGRRS